VGIYGNLQEIGDRLNNLSVNTEDNISHHCRTIVNILPSWYRWVSLAENRG